MQVRSPRSISWARVLSEGAVIVVSILLAFWIDAWWDGRQSREDERAVLDALRTELGQIKLSVDDVLDFHVAILASTYRLAELSERPEPGVSDSEIDRLLGDQSWLSSPENFSAPVLNAVLHSGDMSVISSQELRLELTLLAEKFDWMRSVLQEDLDFVYTYLFPHLFEHASLLHIGASEQQRPGSSGFVFPESPVKVGTAFSHRELVSSRRFQNLMLHRSIILEDITSLSRTPDLADRIDEAISRIERELDR